MRSIGFVAALVLAMSASAIEPTGGVRVVVTTPAKADLIRGRTDMAPLAGFAQAGERPSNFDVMVVVDVSGSTHRASGADVDGDGETGHNKTRLTGGEVNTDPEDSILAAEVAAGRAMLTGLKSERVRVGVVGFSGEYDPGTGRRRSVAQTDATLEQALTSDYAQVERALEAVQLRGPHGGTNMEAGLKLALRELVGLSGALSTPRDDAKKVILMLTDGTPSLPFGTVMKQDPEDIEAAIAAARLAKAGGITINVFGLGPAAIEYPVAAKEIARVTGGLYTPVRRPADIVAALTGVSFANVEDVVAINLTLGEMADPDDILLQPDGSFEGFFPVRQGLNRIRVSALASDGTRGSTEFEIEFRHQDMTDAELEAERARIRKRNRELELALEHEKQKRFREEIRRELEIRVEPED